MRKLLGGAALQRCDYGSLIRIVIPTEPDLERSRRERRPEESAVFPCGSKAVRSAMNSLAEAIEGFILANTTD
jgi:hypothetical protein